MTVFAFLDGGKVRGDWTLAVSAPVAWEGVVGLEMGGKCGTADQESQNETSLPNTERGGEGTMSDDRIIVKEK